MGSDEMTCKKRGRPVLALKLVALALLLGYLIHSGKLDLGALKIPAAGYPKAAAGVVLLLVAMFISFVRFHLLARAAEIPIRFVETLRICLIGLFFNTCMPGAVGGDVVKAGYLIKEKGCAAESLACTVTDRVLGLLGLVCVGGIALLLSWQEVLATESLHVLALVVFGVIGVVAMSSVHGLTALAKGRKVALLLWSAVALAAGGGAVLALADNELALVGPAAPEALLRGRAVLVLGVGLLSALGAALVLPSCQPGRTLARVVETRVPLGHKLMEVVQRLLLFSDHFASVVLALVMSMGLQCLAMLALYAFSQSLMLDHPPSLTHILFAGPPAFVVNALPISFGGLGVGEAALEEMLAFCRTASGDPVTGGANLFLAFRVWQVLLSLIGLPFYLHGKREVDAAREAYTREADAEGASPASES